MQGLINVLEISRVMHIKKVYWPSSIGVFGPDSPKKDTPQKTVMNPVSVYGISKLAGEQWCAYYSRLYGLDTRSLRYPGLIGYKTMPGGGTTDYAVDIFFKALENNAYYECFLHKDTMLPMMYMPDAVRATLELMECEKKKLSIHDSYNLAGMSFTPAEITREIQKSVPGLRVEYKPDFRQQIADSWPDTIDDSTARSDWGWKHEFDLASMAEDMIRNIGDRQ
jgi:nucleoside-diphosphate-sugar epimerase